MAENIHAMELRRRSSSSAGSTGDDAHQVERNATKDIIEYRKHTRQSALRNGSSIRNHSKNSVLEAGKASWIRCARQRSVYSKEVILSEKRADRSRHVCLLDTRTKRKRDGSLDGGMEEKSKRVDTSQREDITQVVDMDVDMWEPPVSPYGLLEEEQVIFRDPWKLFISCILLNRTTAVQVRSVVWDLLKAYPTPESMVNASEEDLERLIKPLGIYKKRAVCIRRFSSEYLSTPKEVWNRDPTVLFGVGQYASDAFKIFCLGQWQSVTPEDKDLRRYVEFLSRTDGLGVGFRRDVPF